MTTELVPDSVFRFIISALTGGVSSWLVFWDVRNIWRLRKLEKTPLVRDRYFGYGIGLVIAVIGITGTIKFNLSDRPPASPPTLTAPR